MPDGGKTCKHMRGRRAPNEKSELRALTAMGYQMVAADMLFQSVDMVHMGLLCQPLLFFCALASFDLVPDHDGADDDEEKKKDGNGGFSVGGKRLGGSRGV